MRFTYLYAVPGKYGDAALIRVERENEHDTEIPTADKIAAAWRSRPMPTMNPGDGSADD